MIEFAASIERSKAKSFSFKETSPALPLYSAGRSAPDSHYMLALCALAMPSLCQILNMPLAVARSLSTAGLSCFER